MDKAKKQYMEEEIRDIKLQNIEQTARTFIYCVSTYIYSVIKLGKDNAITKQVIDIWKNYLAVHKEEKKYLKNIIKYASMIDSEEAEAFLSLLDDININTITYYYDFLDDIELACDSGMEWLAARQVKTFNTLLETDTYRYLFCGMLLKDGDIKDFLNLTPTFWTYIKEKTIMVDSRASDKQYYGVNLIYDGNILVDMTLFVPYIINLETALVSMMEYRRAYEYYELLGQEKDEINGIDKHVKMYKKSFEDNYLANKVTQYFN